MADRPGGVNARCGREELGYWNAWFYNVSMAFGLSAILAGTSQGREYAEFPWIVDVFVLIAFGLWLTPGVVAVRYYFVPQDDIAATPEDKPCGAVILSECEESQR